MSRTSGIAALSLLAFVGCGDNTPQLVDGFSAAEWAKISTFGPLAPPDPDPTNQYADNPMAATFGQRLFFEKSYSGAIIVGDDGSNGGLGAVGDTGKVGCVSCHDPNQLVHRHALQAGQHLARRQLHRAQRAVAGQRRLLQVDDLDRQVRLARGATAPARPRRRPTPARPPRVRPHGLRQVQERLQRASSRCRSIPRSIRRRPTPAASRPSGMPKASAVGARRRVGDDGARRSADRRDHHVQLRQVAAGATSASSSAATRPSIATSPATTPRSATRPSAASSCSSARRRASTCHTGTTLTDQDFHATGVPQTGPNVMAMTITGRYAAMPAVLANAYNGQGAFSDDTDRRHDQARRADAGR